MPPTLTDVRVRSVADARTILYACIQGILIHVESRLDAFSRSQLAPGQVFVWQKGQGMHRFTDGRKWSPSRLGDGCLFYYEAGQDKEIWYAISILLFSLLHWAVFRSLVKKTYSAVTTAGSKKWNLTSYYTASTVNDLKTIHDFPELQDISIPLNYFLDDKKAQFNIQNSDTSSSQSHRSFDGRTLQDQDLSTNVIRKILRKNTMKPEDDQLPLTCVNSFPSSSPPSRSTFSSRLARELRRLKDQILDDRQIASIIGFFSCNHKVGGGLQLPTQPFLSKFIGRLSAIHNEGLTLFAASEMFTVFHQGGSVALGCLAVLRSSYDDYTNHVKRQSVRARNCGWQEVLVDFVLIPISNNLYPPYLIEMQNLGSSFENERQKRAAWALSQLHPITHAKDSSNFMWLSQRWNVHDFATPIVQLMPGSGTPLQSLQMLKLQLYHPANAASIIVTMRALDDELLAACTEAVEDWLIAVLIVCQRNRKPGILEAYLGNAVFQVKQQVSGFTRAGFTKVLGVNTESEKEPTMLFEELEIQVEQIVAALAQQLRENIDGASFLPKARDLSRLLYLVLSSYILLNPSERLKHDLHCRPNLNLARSSLADVVHPDPLLLWNYLPGEWHNQARLWKSIWEMTT